MQVLHHHRPMLFLLRAFVTVSEEGSIRRAARRLHSSQSALSRQMQGLEAYLGGQLLERTTTGVRLTNGGRALLAKASALLASFDDTIVEVRRLLRGQSEHLRVGYVGSAADAYLEPALARLRSEAVDERVVDLGESGRDQLVLAAAPELGSGAHPSLASSVGRFPAGSA